TGSRSGWSQNRGISMPSSSAARMIRVPLGTAISFPSMVTVTSWGPAPGPPVTALPPAHCGDPGGSPQDLPQGDLPALRKHLRREPGGAARPAGRRRQDGRGLPQRAPAQPDVLLVFVTEELD